MANFQNSIFKKNSNGFTLFELLVSISIMAILMAIAIVSYGPGQKKARDNRRTADLEKVRIALEMYRQEKGSYPTDINSLVPTYIQEIPIDPKSPDKKYCFTLNNKTYELFAQMELTVGTSSCGSEGIYSYSVKNP